MQQQLRVKIGYQKSLLLHIKHIQEVPLSGIINDYKKSSWVLMGQEEMFKEGILALSLFDVAVIFGSPQATSRLRPK